MFLECASANCYFQFFPYILEFTSIPYSTLHAQSICHLMRHVEWTHDDDSLSDTHLFNFRRLCNLPSAEIWRTRCKLHKIWSMSSSYITLQFREKLNMVRCKWWNSATIRLPCEDGIHPHMVYSPENFQTGYVIKTWYCHTFTINVYVHRVL